MLTLAARTASVFPPHMFGDGPPPLTEQQLMGRALRTIRKRQGMTQAQAAEAYNVEPTTWRRYEGGERDLSVDQLKKMARSLGSSWEELLEARERLGPDGVAAPDEGPRGMEAQPRYATTTVAGRRQAVFNLEEGDAVFTYPANLSPGSRAELAEYLAILLRRLAT